MLYSNCGLDVLFDHKNTTKQPKKYIKPQITLSARNETGLTTGFSDNKQIHTQISFYF